MSKQFLNLDILSDKDKDVQLNGKKYVLKGVSIKALLGFLDDIDDITDQEQIKKSLEFFNNLCPTGAADKVFDDLNMKQMFALINFITSSVKEDAEENKAAKEEVDNVDEAVSKKK